MSQNEIDKLNVKKKKVVCVAPMNYNKLSKIEKDLYAQKILEFKNNKTNVTGAMRDNINGTLFQSSFNNKTGTGFLDQNLEKRIRVLRFFDTHNDNGKTITLNDNAKENDLTYLSEDLMKSQKNKFGEERNFYDTLNYTNYIKNLNKDTLIERTIAESNKNILSIALIQGEPHYFNFILTNESSHEELYHIIISKNDDKEKKGRIENENQNSLNNLNDESKNEKSINFRDNTVRLVTYSK